MVACLIAAGIIAFTLFWGKGGGAVTKNSPLDLGQKYLSQLEYDKAISQFENIISDDPNNSQAYLELAKSYKYMGDIDSAVQTLQKGYDTTQSELIKTRLDEFNNVNTSPDGQIQSQSDEYVEIGGQRFSVNSKEIILRGCGLKNDDLDTLSKFKQLEWLDISNNEISDIKPIENIKTLKKFYAANNQITDVSPLENLTCLENVGLRNNSIKSADCLFSLPNLQYLHLSDNQLTSVPTIGENLKLLYIANNKISDVNSIKKSKQLLYYDINGN